ncbi:MAG TPA: hypothetical protein ENJ53_11370 [Phaeodactylibacter sp.]|nr:hypothetical protein [Phaeodactylibacter sp.]
MKILVNPPSIAVSLRRQPSAVRRQPSAVRRQPSVVRRPSSPTKNVMFLKKGQFIIPHFLL